MTIETLMIDYPSNGQTTPGYLARPAGDGRFPGVVVLQEWWGLVPHIKDVAERFARAGFVALAPDLYHGQAAGEPDEARKLAMGLEVPRALAEIRAAGRYLQQQEEVQPRAIGVVGWCMGGGLALNLAAQPGGLELGAVVAFYGRPPGADLAAKIETAVLGLYGSADQGIPVETVRAFEATLRANGIPHTIHIYDGAPHAFFNDTRPHIYRPEAAADAWEKSLAWFRRHHR